MHTRGEVEGRLRHTTTTSCRTWLRIKFTNGIIVSTLQKYHRGAEQTGHIFTPLAQSSFLHLTFTSTMLDSTTLIQWPGWLTVLCFSFISSILLLLTRLQNVPRSLVPSTLTTPPQSAKDADEPNCYPPVEPLPDFDWKTTESVKIRPFKPKYNLTMSTLFSPICHGK